MLITSVRDAFVSILRKLDCYSCTAFVDFNWDKEVHQLIVYSNTMEEIHKICSDHDLVVTRKEITDNNTLYVELKLGITSAKKVNKYVLEYDKHLNNLNK